MAVLRGVQYEASFWLLDGNGNPVSGQASNLTAYVRQYGSNAYSTGAGSIYEVTIGGSGTGEYLYVPTATEMNTRVLTVRLTHATYKVYPFCAQIWTEDGYVSSIKAKTDKLTFDDMNNVYAYTTVLDSNAAVTIWTYSTRTLTGNVTVGGYASGQNPANYVLLTPANKLATDASGRVTVGSNADKSGYQVGSYATGQSPAEQVLVTPGNKLATDASGRVTVGSNADKSGYTLTSGEHTQIQSDVQSGMSAQGYTSARAPGLDNLDATVSSRAAPGAAMTLTSGERSNVASAVWGFVLESAKSAAEFMRLMLAVLAGKRTVDGNTETYYGLDGTTARVVGSVDGQGNRNITTRNP